jgi:hypothetical protein
MPASVAYLRVSPALHDALQQQAATSGVSLNTFAVQALAAAVGPERRKPIVDQYVTYWVDRLGTEQMSRVIANSKDHDRVWAWYVGREAELATLAAT